METFVGRKVNVTLLKQLKSGNHKELLEYIKSDKELRFEVRREGHAKIYYKKCLALDLGARSRKVDEKYFTNSRPSEFDLGLDIALSEPAEYFRLIKAEIDNWQSVKNKNKLEFVAQQKIADTNQSPSNRYIIIDMEYNLSQAGVDQKEKRSGYDLVAIDRTTGNIILFEVKCGSGALSGKAGLDTHADDFQRNFKSGNNVERFTEQLKIDIMNIVTDKIELGIITDFNLSSDFAKKTNNDIYFQFIYVFDKETEELEQRDKYNKIIERSNRAKNYNTVFMNFNYFEI